MGVLISSARAGSPASSGAGSAPAHSLSSSPPRPCQTRGQRQTRSTRMPSGKKSCHVDGGLASTMSRCLPTSPPSAPGSPATSSPQRTPDTRVPGSCSTRGSGRGRPRWAGAPPPTTSSRRSTSPDGPACRLPIKGGGHHACGFSLVEDGFVIDLSAMRDVAFDPGSTTATVGPGCGWRDVDLVTYVESLFPVRPGGRPGTPGPGGECPTVSNAGHSLGGGYGLLGRRFGLGCDHILEAEMVDAEGRVLSRIRGGEPRPVLGATRGGRGRIRRRDSADRYRLDVGAEDRHGRCADVAPRTRRGRLSRLP